jgi:tRNA uridine 5-carboxymethylaminomethyl modification enzyme
MAAARLGRKVAVISLTRKHIGRLSCNPAIGGLAKGNLVREIDALGGAMARVADRTSIQFRRLNTRRGLAVQSSRAQVDIDRYPEEMARTLLGHPNISFIEGEAAEIRTRAGRADGITMADGSTVDASAVVLTTGTFLAGVMHCGKDQTEGGRIGDRSAHRMSRSLLSLGLRLGRLKTGTTPRLDAKSIHWDKLQRQVEVVENGRFSFTPPSQRMPQADCYVAYTNPDTHRIIRGALDRSPMFSGQIVGRGPRYCPSIEDKVVRFADRERHQLFLEPEGLDTPRIYVNGLSTSLPADVQLALVRSIEGLEDAQILQHGYAVEYDFSDPRDLDHGLQHSNVPGLFLAGQVNGTSGYEEAAAQGLIAGASAAMGEPLRLGRETAYIGVLVDDLVTRGVGGEPYRMFSSRAEHRLLLREDNADRRLTPRGRDVGLVGDEQWARFSAKRDAIAQTRLWCEKNAVTPTPEIVARCNKVGTVPPKKKSTAATLLCRPEVSWDMLTAIMPDTPQVPEDVAEQVITDFRYAGYLRRAEQRAVKTRRMAGVSLAPDMDFRLPGLSNEVVERLTEARPKTLGAAARLPGVTPAAIDVLAIHIARRPRTSK